MLQAKLNWIYNLTISVVFTANQIYSLENNLVYKIRMSIGYLNPNAFLTSTKAKILEIISRNYPRFIYIMQNAGLDEAQAGIKILRRHINNLRYADDTTLTVESRKQKTKEPLDEN